MLRFNEFLADEEASGVVEMILIIVIIIAVVVVFHDRLEKVVKSIFDRIDKDAAAV